VIQFIRDTLNENYYYAKARWIVRYHQVRSRGKPPIVVYQMGKVGSSTVVTSLKALSLDRPIYHIHTLTEEGIADGEKIYEDIYRGRPRKFSRMSHLLASRYLRKELAKGVTGGKWKVITLVREPITRNVSDFFQLLDWWLPGFTTRYKARGARIDEAIAVFLEKYRYHNEPLTWLDIELKQACDVDVFVKEFPKAKGYDIYNGKQVEVLLLKLEQLDQCASEAVREFLGVKHFRLIKANVSDEKEYGTAYKDFVNALVLPEAYLTKMYNSKYARHFYSDEELDRFRWKWCKPLRSCLGDSRS